MRRVAGEGGFTLVEAILSLIVLGIALVPLINLFAQGAERHTLPDEVVAASLAASKMEELLANRATQGWGVFETGVPTVYTDVDAVNFPNYKWKAEVVNVAQTDFNLVTAGTRFKRVTVFIQKPDLQEFKLVTMATQY